MVECQSLALLVESWPQRRGRGRGGRRDQESNGSSLDFRNQSTSQSIPESSSSRSQFILVMADGKVAKMNIVVNVKVIV